MIEPEPITIVQDKPLKVCVAGNEKRKESFKLIRPRQLVEIQMEAIYLPVESVLK